MKKLTTLITLILLCAASLFAQAPERFTYQAVVRNATNQLVANANVGVRVTMLQGSANGAVVYVETHTVTTNANGLLTLEIGGGTAQLGTVAAIDWSDGPYFLKTEIDPDGGTNYSVTSTQQMLSVPYALYAAAAGNVPAIAVTPTDTGYVLVLTSADGTTASYVLRNGVDGQDGAQGPQGPAGPQGPQGDQGPQGATGATGPEGPAGATGATGSEGPQGPAGAAGADGFSPTVTTVSAGDSTVVTITDATGPHTFVIHNGEQGATGATGPQGEQGPAGPQGPQGDQGPTGQQGPQGEQGLTGPQGEQGPQGVGITNIIGPISNGLADTYTIILSNGNTTTFTVTNGVDGTDGAPGTPGTDGAPGADGRGIVSITKTGTADNVDTYTITYTTGEPTTFTVTNGTNGINGTDGVDGKSAYDLWIEAGNTGDVVAFLNSLKGADGEQGPQGETGATGPEGPQGPIGPTGADGRGIVSITKTGTADNVDTYTITYTEGDSTTFTVTNGTNGVNGTNGTNGVGIASIVKTGTENLVDTYTITYTDGSTFAYSVTNGAQGETGPTGLQGATGNGIASIVKTATEGNVDTYTITYTDSSAAPSFFTVTNGTNGADGVSPTVTAEGDGSNVIITVTDGTGTHEYTIPTSSGEITQVPSDWNATTGPARILNKPELAAVATSGNYNDLEGLPQIPQIPADISAFNNDAGYITMDSIPANVSAFNNDAGYITAQDIPEIPTVPANVSAFNNDAGYITIDSIPANVSAFDNDAGYITEQDLPEIPTNVSAFNNDAGYITMDSIPANVSAFDNDAGYITEQDIPTALSEFDNDRGFITGDDLPTVNDATLTIQQNGSEVGTFTANQSTNQTVDIDAPTFADMQALINSSLAPLQEQMSQLQNQNAALQSSLDNMNFICGTSTVRDYDGNEYNTVKIGEQCWLKENLRSTHYADGTEIPDGGSTESNTTGYRYDYTSSSIPLEQRGYLYNWPAVMHGAASSNAIPSGVQGICPTGWHVPSDAEWTQLTGYVSGQSQYWCGGNSANIAKALAAATTWGYATYVCSPSEDPASNDATGFSAVAAGYYSYPSFDGTGGSANITTSTADGTSMSWYYNLNYATGEVYRQSYYKSTGLSVRCLRDATSTIGEQLNDLQQQNAALQEENAAMQQELDNLNFVCGVSKVTDYDGNEYNTVKIGEQCWLKENLRSEHYSNGVEIPAGTTTSSTTGYLYDYTTSSIPFEQRGYLYNWPAVMNGSSSSDAVPSGVQGICPVGWHVPSDAEWTQLTDYVSSQSQYLCDGSDNTSIAKALALAASAWWNSSSTVCAVGNVPGFNNATGFGAVPAGLCDGSSFSNAGYFATFWSSTQYASSPYNAYTRNLSYDNAYVFGYDLDKYYGSSVRCLRDNLSMTEQLNSANEQIATQQEQLDNMNFVCGVSTVKDYDGNEYNTVKIGNQCWTKENLRSEHYSNGVEIPAGTTTSTTTGYRYNNTSSSIPFKQRGYLYNWAAVMNGASSSNAIPSGVQGICPVGWHVPSDKEWSQLTDYVSSQSQYLCDASDNTSIAKALAASAWWNSSSTDCAVGKNPGNNNATDFAALPVGIYYTSSSEYIGSGNYVDFWSSTETSSSNAWYRYLNFNYDYVVRNNNHSKSSGFSVRCLRDVADGALGDLVRDLQEQNDNLSRAYECEHNSVVDYDGNVYSAVMIGNQCWMKENLRTMHYSDGVEIPAGSTTSTTTGYVYYNAAPTIPVQQRGYLYNWKAVMRNASSSNANPSGVQGICPTGWHVPSDAEWTQLTDYVKSRSEYWCDENSNNIALALCSPSYWNTVNDSYMYPCYPGSNQGLHNNATGFGALPAGYYRTNGYNNSGIDANFWSATEETSSGRAWFRYLYYTHAVVNRAAYEKDHGYSVRCLRDN